MIEENAVARKQAIAFSVIDRCPVCIELRTTIWTAWPKWRSFPLWSFNCFAEHFTARGLIELCFDPSFSYRFQQTDCAERGYVARVFRDLEAHQNMALSAQMIDFI